jgi:hypothetical protein
MTFLIMRFSSQRLLHQQICHPLRFEAMLPHAVTIPSDIKVGRAVELHELYKSVMIVGFFLEAEASSRARAG